MAALGRLDPLPAAAGNGRNRVRRETGKEQMVRVHYDEGAAIHIGPESCAGGREAVREALTGECAGQPLSREKVDIPGADAVRYAEGHTKGRAIASSPTTRRGRRPWHVQTLFVREPGGLVVDQGGKPIGPHREGEEPKPMMHGREKSDSVIVAMKSPNKTGEPAAEAMERRAGAEENASQQRTRRTQSRESVSQTPERVRTAARFCRHYPRWEPDAGNLHARFWAGGPG